MTKQTTVVMIGALRVNTYLGQSHMFFKVSNKMAYANFVDPDQTAPSGAV